MRIALLTGLLALGLGTACGVKASQLDRPVFFRDMENGLCGSSIAVDVHGEVYSEGGCENGSPLMQHAGHATPEAVARVRDAFTALPGDLTCDGSPSTSTTWQLLEANSATTVRGRWAVDCGTQPAEYTNIDSAFDSLLH